MVERLPGAVIVQVDVVEMLKKLLIAELHHAQVLFSDIYSSVTNNVYNCKYDVTQRLRNNDSNQQSIECSIIKIYL